MGGYGFLFVFVFLLIIGAGIAIVFPLFPKLGELFSTWFNWDDKE